MGDIVNEDTYPANIGTARPVIMSLKEILLMLQFLFVFSVYNLFEYTCRILIIGNAALSGRNLQQLKRIVASYYVRKLCLQRRYIYP